MSFLSIDEFSPDEKPPIPVTIIRADDNGPKFVVLVNRLQPEALAKITKAVAKIGGQRPTSAQTEKQVEEFSERYVKKVFAGWTGATVANINALLKRAAKGKLSDATVKQIAAIGGELPFSVEDACRFLRVFWAEDFDAPIYQAAKYGADEIAEEERGKESA